MKNSNGMCQALFMPFECFGVDSRRLKFPEGECLHSFAEMLLVREGKLGVSLSQDEMTVSPGEAALLCPGVIHRIAAVEPVRMDVIRLDPDRMSAMPEYCASLSVIMAEALRKKMPMQVSAAEAERMALPELSAQCVTETAARAFGYDCCVSGRLSIICMAVIKFWREHGLIMPDRRLAADPIYSLSGYIQRHLREGIRVEDLAAYCGLSYPWFAKKFREIYGISCKDYIEQIRISQVELFLRFTDLDLAEISEATGFADCSHMIKNFKRVMDITPGQYRLRLR